MAKSCITTLASDILNDCNEQYGPGIERTIYAISRNAIDFDASTREGHLITNLQALAGGSNRGYKIGYPSTETPAITVTDQNPPIGTSFEKVLPITLLADSPKNAEAIMALKSDKYVFIYENTVKGDKGDQAFPVIGWEQGAVARDANLDKSNEDTQGGWAVNITESRAKTSQIFFFKTDYATTKAALESLCSE